MDVRTWDGDGINKEAYERIKCELDVRNWCNVSCPVTNRIEYINDKSVSVYPNPAKDAVLIRFDQYTNQPCALKLYNTHGQLVQSVNSINNFFEIERQELKSGIYLFHLVIDNQIYKRGKLIFE